MPVIRVDEDVWDWLKSLARPLEDTPNSVLRRFAGLDAKRISDDATEKAKGRSQMPKVGKLTGRYLNQHYGVGAQHALYRETGDFYNHLLKFPGALFDPNGYVMFHTRSKYEYSRYLQHGQKLHVPGGIASMPDYVRFDKS